MEFNILERIILQELLPREGDYITYRIIKELRTELSFSEDEIKRYHIQQDKDRIIFDSANKETKNVEIGERIKEMIVSALKKLNEEKKINDNNVSLYEKFVGE